MKNGNVNDPTLVIEVGAFASRAHAESALPMLHALIRSRAAEIDKLKEPK